MKGLASSLIDGGDVLEGFLNALRSSYFAGVFSPWNVWDSHLACLSILEHLL